MAIEARETTTVGENGHREEGAVTGTVLEGVRGKVFLDRYSLKDAEGKPVEATPEEMWRRVVRRSRARTNLTAVRGVTCPAGSTTSG